MSAEQARYRRLDLIGAEGLEQDGESSGAADLASRRETRDEQDLEHGPCGHRLLCHLDVAKPRQNHVGHQHVDVVLHLVAAGQGEGNQTWTSRLGDMARAAAFGYQAR
jgi:hypothetical protein